MTYIDLSQTFVEPALSGIQRVTAELCRNWPDEDMVPIRVTSPDKAVALPGELIRILGESFSCPDDSWRRSVRQIGESAGEPMAGPAAGDTVLVPELFYERPRIEFYERMDERRRGRCRFLVYDFLPILYPWFFSPDTPMDLVCSYFRLVRGVAHCGFISEATRENYWQRLRRRPPGEGPVFQLGSDGLGPKPAEVPVERRRQFTVVGRIEPWKNPALILEALEPLLREVGGPRLVFLGRIGDVEQAVGEKIRRMAADPHSGLEHHPSPDDEAIRRHIDQSRATVFVSSAEGFGLPPVESLWRGTPVIASAGIPSLKGIGGRGIHVVEPLTAANLRHAARTFLDDAYVREKSREAGKLDLPTWKAFARQVAAWCKPGLQP